MSNTSCTTTGLRVGDNEASRTPVLAPVTDNTDRLGVKAEGPGASNSGTINSGMSCGSQVVAGATKPVDRRTIEGSTPGDHRAPALKTDITAPFKDAPGPRDRVRQAELSSRTPAAPAPEVTDSAAPVGD